MSEPEVVPCEVCEGSGTYDPFTACEACGGRGVFRQLTLDELLEALYGDRG